MEIHGDTAGRPVDLIGDHNRQLQGDTWIARDWFPDLVSTSKDAVKTPIDCFWEGRCDFYQWLLALT